MTIDRRQSMLRRAQEKPHWRAAFSLLIDELHGLKLLVSLSLFLVLLASALAALTPIVFKILLDQTSSIGPGDDHLLAVLLVCSYAGSLWLARLAAETKSLFVGKVELRLHSRLSLRLFEHVMSLPFPTYLNYKTGGLIQILTNGLTGYRLLIQHLALTLLPVLVEVATMSSVLIVLGQPLFLAIILGSLVCYGIVFAIATWALVRPSREISTMSVDAIATLADSVASFDTVKYFGVERLLNRRVEQAFARVETHWSSFYLLKTLCGFSVGAIFALALGVSMYFASRQLSDGAMTIGDFVLVNAYLLQSFRPVEAIGFAILDIGRGMVFLEKLVGVLQEEPERPALCETSQRTTPSGKVAFVDICFSYAAGRAILKNVSFEIGAGGMVALVGSSGSGKTSIVRLLMRFCEPQSGCIFLDGAPISEISISSLRHSFAVVPQDTILFNDSIGFNISIGSPGSSQAKIESAARVAGIHDLIMSCPDGYGTLVGERGMKLSAGERQRIAIARAVLREPLIYVFDEATAALDSVTEQLILRSIRDVSEGKTSIVIAHRLSTIVNADTILVLADGSIVERGTHQELLNIGGRYSQMWAAQHGSSSQKEWERAFIDSDPGPS